MEKEEEKGKESFGSRGRVAVPGMKRQDGTYVPAVVPPEWEEYPPAYRPLLTSI